MDPSRCKDKYKDKDKEADSFKKKKDKDKNPSESKQVYLLPLPSQNFCLEAKNMNFAQEQSQEEDAKDCTGQISKPVSCNL